MENNEVKDTTTAAVTSYNYVSLATRTESVKTEPMTLSGAQLMRMAIIGSQFQMFGHILDQFKRQLYYNDMNSDGVAAFDATFAVQGMDAVKMPDLTLERSDARLLHGLLGKTTEIVELWQSLGAYLLVPAGPNKDNVASVKTLDVTNVVEETGDGEWYNALILDALNVRYNDMLTANIEKLRRRYPDKFDAGMAVKRDLTAERTILESALQ